MINRKYGIPTVSPGALLREEKRKGTQLGIEADRITSQGRLAPDVMIVEIVRSWMESGRTSFVFDGFPRSIGQAEAFDSLLHSSGEKIDAVIALEADLPTLSKRIASRLVCQGCGAVFGIGLHVRNALQPCAACGGLLGRRSDDTEEILKTRLQEFREKSEPLVEYYRSKGVLHQVNATAAPEGVFDSIQRILLAA